MSLVTPGHPAVVADGDLPGARIPVVVARIEQYAAVFELGDAAFIDLVPGSRSAHLPGFPVVVAVDDMGIVAPGAGLDMVAGDQQPARGKPNAVARTGGVPGPVRALGGSGDIQGVSPREAVVLAGRDPYGPRALARFIDDHGFLVDSEVVGHQQPYGPGLAVDHRAGIAAGVSRVPPNHLLVRPGAAAILAALHEHIDIAGVVFCRFSGLRRKRVPFPWS